MKSDQVHTENKSAESTNSGMSGCDKAEEQCCHDAMLDKHMGT